MVGKLVQPPREDVSLLGISEHAEGYISAYFLKIKPNEISGTYFWKAYFYADLCKVN